MWPRDKIAQAAQEIADHLKLIENVKSIQIAQKELADAMATLDIRLRNIETTLRVSKAETLLEAITKAQDVVNSVQGHLSDRIETLSVKVALLEREASMELISSRSTDKLSRISASTPSSDEVSP